MLMLPILVGRGLCPSWEQRGLKYVPFVTLSSQHNPAFGSRAQWSLPMVNLAAQHPPQWATTVPHHWHQPAHQRLTTKAKWGKEVEAHTPAQNKNKIAQIVDLGVGLPGGASQFGEHPR